MTNTDREDDDQCDCCWDGHDGDCHCSSCIPAVAASADLGWIDVPAGSQWFWVGSIGSNATVNATTNGTNAASSDPRPVEDDVVARAVQALDSLGQDPEVDHGAADGLLLSLVDPRVTEAYRRLVSRSPWWASA